MKTHAKPSLLPDSEGSVYVAYCPMFGTYDIRWEDTLHIERPRRFDRLADEAFYAPFALLVSQGEEYA